VDEESQLVKTTPKIRVLVGEMALGGVLAIMLWAASTHLAWISVHIDTVLLELLIIFAACGLYAIRHFFRRAYGTLEVLVGLLAIFGTMGRAPQIVDDPATASLLLVQTAAGMYIIVRGIDNFAQTEPFASAGPVFMALWSSIRKKR
jgi:hypothetical protein